MAKLAGAMFVSSLPVILAKVQAASEKKMKEAVDAGRKEVIETLRGARHGRRYKVPGMKNAFYTASRPGEPPAAPTGRLRGSVRGRMKSSLFDVTGEVGTPLEYGAILELKKDREWLSVGMKKAEPAIKRILGSRWF